MGLGEIGSPSTVFKRKFRWKFFLTYTCNGIINNFSAFNASSSARPKIEIDEAEINYLGQKRKIPSSGARYTPMTITLHDVGLNDNVQPLYLWLSNFFRTTNPRLGSMPNYTLYANVTLELLDGCGDVIETWLLEECWPQAVDFGELSMENSEVCTIEMTIVYNMATLAVPLEDDCANKFVPSICCDGSISSTTLETTDSGINFSLVQPINNSLEYADPFISFELTAPNISITLPTPEMDVWFSIMTPDLRDGMALMTGNTIQIRFRCSIMSDPGRDCLTGNNKSVNIDIRDGYIDYLNMNYAISINKNNETSSPEISGKYVIFSQHVS